MDQAIFGIVNPLVGQWGFFDHLVALIGLNPLLKGVPVAMLFLYLWCRDGTEAARRRARARLAALLAISVLAIAVGRAAALLLPHRVRPLHAEEWDLRLPASVDPGLLDGWSSFPSDHAVLYAALAAGFWMVDRRAGLLAAAYALVVIAFARVYLTLHYPTDILGGAVVGVGVCLVLMPPLARLAQWARLPHAAERWPELAHPLLFVALFQIASMFNSARAVLKGLVDFLT
jgi:undecaprenyl-diphosphatase